MVLGVLIAIAVENIENSLQSMSRLDGDAFGIFTLERGKSDLRNTRHVRWTKGLTGSLREFVRWSTFDFSTEGPVGVYPFPLNARRPHPKDPSRCGWEKTGRQRPRKARPAKAGLVGKIRPTKARLAGENRLAKAKLANKNRPDFDGRYCPVRARKAKVNRTAVSHTRARYARSLPPPKPAHDGRPGGDGAVRVHGKINTAVLLLYYYARADDDDDDADDADDDCAGRKVIRYSV